MKKVVAVLMTMSLLLCLCAGAMADTVSNVPYIVRRWDEAAKTVVQTETTAASCTVVTSSDTAWGTAGQKSWYVVDKKVIISSRITVTGDVHLILMDGKTLTASEGIGVSGANSLTIYGQSADSGTLTVTNPWHNNAGIGGSKNEVGGTITIHGGKVDANGTNGAAIGGGYNGAGGEITIYGGTVVANSDGGAGIGGGLQDVSGQGTGGIITIYGGTVTATGRSGAGIGGGYKGAGRIITIHGGTVTATGRNGAGIGGGSGGSAGGTITIHGGTVNATGHSGAGIGGGGSSGATGGAGGTIRITGGTVDASSKNGAGIGGGNGYKGGAGGEVTITGGTVTAQGRTSVPPDYRACAIGGGSIDADQGSLTVSGDKVVMFASTKKDPADSERFTVTDEKDYLEKKYAYAHIEVTNELAGEESGTGDLPKTGDPSMLGAWTLLLGASAAGLRLRRKK